MTDPRCASLRFFFEPTIPPIQLEAAHSLADDLLRRYDRVLIRPLYGWHDQHTNPKKPRVPSSCAGVVLHVREGGRSAQFPLDAPEALVADHEARFLFLHAVHQTLGRL